MPVEPEITIKRLEVFAREVLAHRIFTSSHAIECAVLRHSDPHAPIPAIASIASGVFEPVAPPWKWGPKWSTAFFRINAEIPAEFRVASAVLRFSSGTEAMAWVRSSTGEFLPRQGLDVNRDEIALTSEEISSGRVELVIEAACNHPFGVIGFEWDDVEVHRRWQSDTPGIFERCELALRDELAWKVHHRFTFALDLVKQVGTATPRGKQLLDALTLIHASTSAADALAWLEAAIAIPADGSSTVCLAAGHAHIDTAWLWPLRETRRKCIRSFTNQLNLIDANPSYTFMCSQAQQYAWIEEDAPHLFSRITKAVESGQWEPVGGMWIEPDANVPSGESLARQFLYGTNYWTHKFGSRARQRLLYLPDTFGFPASLPQIISLAGCDTFITNKLWWNAVNEFPHTTFIWRGIDGTEILSHNTPGRDYNATNTPRELIRGERSHKTLAPRPNLDSGQPAPAIWLQPFGFGDGGGGATHAMLESAELASDASGLPRVRLAGAHEFCDLLHDQRADLLSRDEDFPAIDGELYLELHRGTLTSQSWIKLANRRAEEDLRLCEILLFAGPVAHEAATVTQTVEKLDRAWKLLLLNQFHDILPGSSIGWVYDDARRDFDRISKITDKFIDRGTTAWLSRLSTEGVREPVGVFNPCSVPMSGVIELEDERLVYAREIPALGVAVVDRANPHGMVPARIDGLTMSNGIIECELDELGRIARLLRLGDRSNVMREDEDGFVPLNQLVLYDDRPHMWDAWDIDAGYEKSARTVENEPESIEIVHEDALRVAIRVRRSLGVSSTIEQTYTLDAGSPRIDIHTKVKWSERRTLLRALFPTRILSDRVTCEIQFGTCDRPTHANTSWDAAKFEFCAHRYMDLSQRGVGIALLNDCKYGHSCRDGVMGLSLLRSPVHPDPQCDQGEHEFTYALMPHDGDRIAAGVDRQAEALNTPLFAYPLNAEEQGDLGRAWSPLTFECDGPCAVSISAIKRAADNDDLIVRFNESHGGEGVARITWKIPVATVEAVDLLERPMHVQGIKHSGNVTTIPLRKFAIISLRVARAK